jgi:hypothetical protein
MTPPEFHKREMQQREKLAENANLQVFLFYAPKYHPEPPKGL